MYHGLVEIETSGFLVDFLVKTTAGVPVNADALPTYRVLSGDGLVNGQAGSAAFRDTGSVTGATNASPIVVTSASHGLTTGTRITVTGVGGNGSANGTFVVTVSDANTFSLDGSSGSGSYTSGGTWNVTGYYAASLDVTAANGFVAGETYSVLVTGLVGAANWGELHTFTVV